MGFILSDPAVTTVSQSYEERRQAGHFTSWSPGLQVSRSQTMISPPVIFPTLTDTTTRLRGPDCSTGCRSLARIADDTSIERCCKTKKDGDKHAMSNPGLPVEPTDMIDIGATLYLVQGDYGSWIRHLPNITVLVEGAGTINMIQSQCPTAKSTTPYSCLSSVFLSPW